MICCERAVWTACVLTLLGLLAWAAVREPIRSDAVGYWKDVYDENGQIVLPQKGKEPYDLR